MFLYAPGVRRLAVFQIDYLACVRQTFQRSFNTSGKTFLKLKRN